ncbi:MAG: hypothetical protein H6727_04055 [Myxococcales bacterium]|nr:hypothetical protein [Myxococcales bacterium]
MLKRRQSAARQWSLALLLGLGIGFILPSPLLAAPTSRPAKKTKHAKKAKRKKSNLYKNIAKRSARYDKILDLMQQEMQRYMGYFAKQPLPKVYSLRYRMLLRYGVLLRATDGVISATVDNRKSPACNTHVSIRVGDNKFDQTGQDGRDWSIYRTLLPANSTCTSKLHPEILKKQLWIQTDREYRVATASYWRKRYIRSIKPKLLDKAGDFTKEAPTLYQAPLAPRLQLDKKKWKAIIRKITGQTRKDPRVLESQISIDGDDHILLGVGNDGSRVRTRQHGYTWTVTIKYIGKNKEYVTSSRNGYARTEAELPTEAQLQATHDDLLTNLKRITQSEEGEPDEGPAIVDPMLAGAMFFDILMSRFGTGRFLLPSDQRFFEKKLGHPIIPAFLSVYDDPTLTHWGKTPLNSHYLYDDEWVRARRLTMIKDGVLKQFYMSRKPYKKMQKSNGHGRSAFGRQAFSRPGTTIVESKRAVHLKKLRAMLIQEAKKQGQRYAYILRRFSGYSQVSGAIYSATPDEVIQIDVKTGKEKHLKGLRIRTGAMQLMKGILATGQDAQVFNGADGEFSGNINIAVVSPSLLIQRVSLNRYKLDEKKDFELPPPQK